MIINTSNGTTSATVVSSITSYAGATASSVLPTPRPCSLIYDGRPYILQLSLDLPRFADKNFLPSMLQSILVAAQPYPPSPESHASMVCVDLDAFATEGSRSNDGHSPVSLVEQPNMSVSLVKKDRVSVSSVNSGDDEQTDISLELSRFEPLNHPTSPVHSGASQVVVESPSHYEAPAVPVAISALLDSVS